MKYDNMYDDFDKILATLKHDEYLPTKKLFVINKSERTLRNYLNRLEKEGYVESKKTKNKALWRLK